MLGLRSDLKFGSRIASEFLYWDNNPGRASITRKMNHDQARESRACPRASRAGCWEPPTEAALLLQPKLHLLADRRRFARKLHLFHADQFPQRKHLGD
jgi:hypothetical protein